MEIKVKVKNIKMIFIHIYNFKFTLKQTAAPTINTCNNLHSCTAVHEIMFVRKPLKKVIYSTVKDEELLTLLHVDTSGSFTTEQPSDKRRIIQIKISVKVTEVGLILSEDHDVR